MKSFKNRIQSLNQIKVPHIMYGFVKGTFKNYKRLHYPKIHIESYFSYLWAKLNFPNMLLISYSSPNLIHYSWDERPFLLFFKEKV